MTTTHVKTPVTTPAITLPKHVVYVLREYYEDEAELSARIDAALKEGLSGVADLQHDRVMVYVRIAAVLEPWLTSSRTA